MRHGNKNNSLGRKAAHRELMLSNMACSLIEHKRINTTVAKAKVLRRYIEPILTRSKEDTTHNRRIAFSELRNKYAVTTLFREISSKIGDRPGGYTRIIKLGNRLGDNADMAMIELVDFNETYDLNKSVGKKSTRRRRSKKPANVLVAGEADAPKEILAKQSISKVEAEKKAIPKEVVPAKKSATPVGVKKASVTKKDSSEKKSD